MVSAPYALIYKESSQKEGRNIVSTAILFSIFREVSESMHIVNCIFFSINLTKVIDKTNLYIMSILTVHAT